MSLPFFVFPNCRYNERAKEWINGGMEFFRDVPFEINKVATLADQTATGKFYPVRDSCMKKDDPAEKCLLTEALFYKGYVSLEQNPSERVSVEITSSSNTVANNSYPSTKKVYYSASDLGCSKDTYAFSSSFILVPSVDRSVIAREENGALPIKLALSLVT